MAAGGDSRTREKKLPLAPHAHVEIGGLNVVFFAKCQIQDFGSCLGPQRIPAPEQVTGKIFSLAGAENRLPSYLLGGPLADY